MVEHIDFDACGLTGVLATWGDHHTVTLKNVTDSYANLKLSFLRGLRWVSFGNVPLRPGLSRDVSLKDKENDVILIHSDASPKAGVFVMASSEKVLKDKLLSLIQSVEPKPLKDSFLIQLDRYGAHLAPVQMQDQPQQP